MANVHCGFFKSKVPEILSHVVIIVIINRKLLVFNQYMYQRSTDHLDFKLICKISDYGQFCDSVFYIQDKLYMHVLMYRSMITILVSLQVCVVKFQQGSEIFNNLFPNKKIYI